jgi:MFS family permease
MTLGSFSAGYFTKAFSYRFLMPIVIITISSSLAFIGLYYNLYFTLALFLLLEYALGVFRPVSSVLINELIPSDVRATILSLYSTVNSIFSSGGSYLAGYLADRGEYKLLYIISGLITIISIPIVIKPIRRRAGD